MVFPKARLIVYPFGELRHYQSLSSLAMRPNIVVGGGAAPFAFDNRQINHAAVTRCRWAAGGGRVGGCSNHQLMQHGIRAPNACTYNNAQLANLHRPRHSSSMSARLRSDRNMVSVHTPQRSYVCLPVASFIVFLRATKHWCLLFGEFASMSHRFAHCCVRLC